MREKQRLLGIGLMSRSVRALLMMVCIWARKKRTLLGFTAPSWFKISASAIRNCSTDTA